MKGELRFTGVPARVWRPGRRPRGRGQKFVEIGTTKAYRRIMAMAGAAIKRGGFAEVTFEATGETAPAPRDFNKRRRRIVCDTCSGRIVWGGE